MIKQLVLLILILSTLLSCTQDSKEIVFVCTHGAARSPIAAAYFNKLAQENNLDYHAVFRGTEPDDELSKATISGLKQDGFEVNNWKPEPVSSQDVAGAFKVITFDCTVPINNSSTLKDEWNGTPSISKDYSKARDVIKTNVEELIESLKKK